MFFFSVRNSEDQNWYISLVEDGASETKIDLFRSKCQTSRPPRCTFLPVLDHIQIKSNPTVNGNGTQDIGTIRYSPQHNTEVLMVRFFFVFKDPSDFS